VYVFSRVDSWNSLWTGRQHPLVTDYSIYWWPSAIRSTNVNHSDNASSPISKCALWLKCPRPFWKKCDQGVEDSPFIILNNSIKSALFLLSSRDQSPNWRNLVSYGNGNGWRRGVVVSGVRRMNEVNGYTISVYNKPTQPCIPPGSLNRVPASATLLDAVCIMDEHINSVPG